MRDVIYNQSTRLLLVRTDRCELSVSLFAVMILVDPGLYIGTAADLNDRQALADAAVTHVLSVDSVDATPQLPADGAFRLKLVYVLDEVTS